MNDSFIFYHSFAKGIKRLSPEQQLKAFWAIVNYAVDGIEPPDEDEDELYVGVFEMAQPQIDSNMQKRKDGQKGGRPKKTNGYEKEKPVVSKNEENKKPNVNVNVNVNDNVNANDNDNVNANVNANDNTFCPESETAPDEIAASFALNDGTLYNVTENDVVMYQQLYPGIDCRQELRNITGWCDANPSRRKTRSGAKRFLNNWLSRAQNQAKPPVGSKKSTGSAYIDAINNRMDVVDEWLRKRQEVSDDG